MKKTLISIMLATVLAGCSTQYNLIPTKEIKQSDTISFISNKFSNVTVENLTQKFDHNTDLVFKITIRNTSNRLLTFKAEDIRIGFNNFWFDVVNYEILNKERKIDFINDSNFKLIHEVLPNDEIVLKVTFDTPYSREYYQNKKILLEIYNSLGLFDFNYVLKTY